jgi:hypothetical protein
MNFRWYASQPVAIISFNRPHYLRSVLDSLLAQAGINGRRVFLFQDNAVSPFSNIRYATDEDVAQCLELFRARFPDGHVFLAPHNLGVARNILRAEKFVFETLASEIAYFFEDDMVLSPHYLTMMDRLSIYAARTDRVGYFSAYGNLVAPVEKQRLHATTMRRLDYNWGFGLTYQHWTELQQWLAPYNRLCDGCDYNARPIEKILRHYQAIDVPLIGTTQDVVKKLGTYALGRVAINTNACFGKNIGVVGLHFHPEKFQRDGFANTELYPEAVELTFPSSEQLARFHTTEMNIRWANFHAFMGKAKPSIPVTDSRATNSLSAHL